jgi:hypothetical protein
LAVKQPSSRGARGENRSSARACDVAADDDSQIANLRLSERQATDATQQSHRSALPNSRLGSGWEAPGSKKPRQRTALAGL